jgi:hypothetical protein
MAVPAPAAVTLTDGRAVPGLEPTPAGWRLPTAMPATVPSAEAWLWSRIAAEGLDDAAPEPMVLAVADLADLVATEFARVGPSRDAAAPAFESEATIQALGVLRPGGTRREPAPTDGVPWQAPTAVGMRVGRAGRMPLVPETAALSFLGGGVALGLVVRRRRT